MYIVYRILDYFFGHPVIGGRWTSWLVTKLRVRIPIESPNLRGIIANQQLSHASVVQNHTHGKCASDRNTATISAIRFATLLGLEPYFIQMSKANERHGMRGCRTYYWDKDLSVEYRQFDFDPRKQAGILIDVDQYIDMNVLLAKHPGTYFVYTFTPTKPAKSEGEYVFQCDDKGTFTYSVSGGATFSHKIWDYNHDTITVQRRLTAVTYHVDRKYIDAHHTLLTLSVIAVLWWPSLFPILWLVSGSPLNRLNPVRGQFRVLDCMTVNGLERSIAGAGSYTAVTVPMEKLDRVTAVARASNVPITQSMVASHINTVDESGFPTCKVSLGDAALVALYLRQEIKAPPIVASVEPMKEVAFSTYSLESKPVLQAFGSPLINPAYVPKDDIWTEKACIDGRVAKFQSRPIASAAPSPVLTQHMREFATLLVPDDVAGSLAPLSLEEVMERQPRPTQRMILQQSEGYANRNPAISSFTKAETYMKPTEARNISTLQSEVKRDYSAYTYAFCDVIMQAQPWYAFNKTPAEIATRVAHLASQAFCCVDSDGHRWDGHVSRILRELETIVMMRAFRRDFHGDLSELMGKQYSCPGWTRHGFAYDVGFSRASGSPETSPFNSVDAAFIEFLGRKLMKKAMGETTVSLDELGLHGGDDSLIFNLDAKCLRDAAELVGQEYDINIVNYGESGVNFLNRYYSPQVWDGCLDSICHVRRALGKIFIGPKALQKPLERFFDRAYGYLLTDVNTPILGLLTRAARQFENKTRHELTDEFDPRRRAVAESSGWWATFATEVQWPNNGGDWMWDYVNGWLPNFDHTRFEAWLEEIYETSDSTLFLRAPMCEPPEDVTPKIECYVNGNYHSGDKVKVNTAGRITIELSEDDEPVGTISQKQPRGNKSSQTDNCTGARQTQGKEEQSPRKTIDKQSTRPKPYKGRDPIKLARNQEYIANWDAAHKPL